MENNFYTENRNAIGRQSGIAGLFGNLILVIIKKQVIIK